MSPHSTSEVLRISFPDIHFGTAGQGDSCVSDNIALFIKFLLSSRLHVQSNKIKDLNIKIQETGNETPITVPSNLPALFHYLHTPTASKHCFKRIYYICTVSAD